MARKKIWYWVRPHSSEDTSFWWVGGYRTPMTSDDVRAKNRDLSNQRSFYRWTSALAAALRCPAGATLVKFFSVYGKRRRRSIRAVYELVPRKAPQKLT